MLPRDEIGQRFSKLVVLAIHTPRGKHQQATCVCDCGVTRDIRLVYVLDGRQKSCGCSQGSPIHGKSRTSIYTLWRSMRDRCENPNKNAYRFYGARGIKVCGRWRRFENFYADMGDRPEDKTLDRIDSNGNYEPSNCRWATILEQTNNSRRNHLVCFHGEQMSIADAIRASGVKLSKSTIYNRIHRGWSIDAALFTEVWI